MGVSVRIVNGKVVSDPFPTVPPHLEGKVGVVHSVAVTPPTTKSPYHPSMWKHMNVKERSPTTTRRRTTKRRTTPRRSTTRSISTGSRVPLRSFEDRPKPKRRTPARKTRVERKSKRISSKRNIVYGATKEKRRSMLDDLW